MFTIIFIYWMNILKIHWALLPVSMCVFNLPKLFRIPCLSPTEHRIPAYAPVDLKTRPRLRVEGTVSHFQINLFCDRENIPEICSRPLCSFAATRSTVNGSRCRRHRPTPNLPLPAVIVQIVERPLCLGLTTTEPIHK